MELAENIKEMAKDSLRMEEVEDPFLVTWDGPEDPTNPRNFPNTRKQAILFAICAHSLVLGISSTIVAPTIFILEEEFSLKPEVAILVVSLCVLGWAFGPLAFSPLSEIYGRNFVHRITWIPFVLFNIGSAVSPTAPGILICRFFVGVFGSPLTALGPTHIYEIHPQSEVGPILFLVCLSAFIGPPLGELCGGLLVQYSNSWRWPYWLLSIVGGVLILNGLWFPETNHKIVLQQKAARLRKETGDERYHAGLATDKISKHMIMKTAIFRPLQLLMFEPIILLCSLLIGLVWGILYLYLAAYTIVFGKVYNWQTKEGNIGAAFMGIGVGVLLSFFAAGYSNKLFNRLREKHGTLRGEHKVYPEGRLPPAMVASVVVPGAVFWFAWTADAGIHWIVPVLSGVPFGISMVILFLTFITYITDCYPDVAASANAANALLRYLFSALFPMFSVSLYNNIDMKWATTLLGFLALALMPVPFVFYKFGPWIRGRSRFRPKYT